MNVIKINVLFEKGVCSKEGISLVSGDYNSTKMVFNFDIEEGIKILKIINSKDEIIYLGEIINNEVMLVSIVDGKVQSLFPNAGDYKYEISLYEGDSKLTSVYDYFTVNPGGMSIPDEEVEPYLPVFDELTAELSKAIEETENLDIDAEKDGSITTVTITKKDGVQKTVDILDGAKGDTGEKGEAGQDATINGVNTLNIVAGKNVEIEQTEDTLTISSESGYDDTEIKADIQSLEDTKVDKEVNKGLSTNDYTNEEKTKLAGLTNYDDTEVKSEISDIKLNYALKTENGSVVELSINPSTFVMTLNLKNSVGTILSTDDIDLPLETMVVGASYDSTTKEIVLTLKSGSTTRFSVADLVNGLQSEITSTNKLDSSLVDDSLSNNKFVTPAEKTIWNNKSDFSGDYNDLTNKPTIPTIPTNISAFTNDAGYINTETDPVFSNSPASGITSNDISNWNSKQDTLTFDSTPTQNSTNPVTSDGIYQALQNAGGGSDGKIKILGTINDFNTQTKALDLMTLKNGIYLINTSYYNGNQLQQTSRTFYIKVTTPDGVKYGSIGLSGDVYSNYYNEAVIFVVDNEINSSADFSTSTYRRIGRMWYQIRNSSTAGFYNRIIRANNSNVSTSEQSSTFSYSNYVSTNNVQTISGKKTFSTLPESSVTPTTDNQLTRKGYVDSLLTTYSGYDATKTQVLKNVNGTLTWITEE